MGLPVDEGTVTETEIKGEFRFPTQWKQLLMASNGFEIEANIDTWQGYPVKDTSSNKHLSRSANHVLWETEQLKKYSRFPANAIAVGANGAGDALIINKRSNEIFAWFHETGALTSITLNFDLAMRKITTRIGAVRGKHYA